MPQNRVTYTETHAFQSDESLLTVNILTKSFYFFFQEF
jgi:hypothetical protein